MLRIAHRGGCGHAPENTLRAISAGIETGSDLIELDVQSTRDGRFVIMHDKRVDRTTNGRGYVTEMTSDELKRLDAGSGERIPFLEEVLDLVDGKAGLMLEIITPGIGGLLVESVKRHGFRGRLIIASFLHTELLATVNAPRLALLEGIPINPTAFALDAQASHVGISAESITRSYVEALQMANLRVFVYTPNDTRDIERIRAFHVDGIISDFPERVPKE